MTRCLPRPAPSSSAGPAPHAARGPLSSFPGRLLGHLGVLPEAAPGMTFLVSAVLVAVPTVLLAWLSSRTIESAGPKLLATIDGSGNARDYYPHVEDGRA